MKRTISVAKVMVTLICIVAAITVSSCNKISGLDEFDLRRVEVHDTTTLVVHDTTRVVVRDTTVVHDTVKLTDTVRINELDTVIVHDTVFRPDTVVVGGDTVIRWDTIVSHDTTVVDRLRTTATRHLSWDGVTLNGSQLWLAGTDRLVVSVIENGNTVQNDSTTYHHRSRFAYSGISGNTFPSSVSGNTYRLVGGTVIVGGNTITTSWVSDEIIEASVVIRGTNYRGMLHACHGTAVYWHFSNGTATCHFEDAYGNAAGTYSTPYDTDTPTRRLVSADTTYQHLSTNATGVWSAVASTMTWSCSNRRTITRHYNMAPLTETDQLNFTIGFPYTVSVSGSAIAAMLGSTVTITSGVATFTSGGQTLVVTLTALARTCTITPIPLPCQHQLTTATLASNGSGGYKVVVHGTLEGTATTGDVPVTATPRQEVSRDTTWVNTCGQVTNTVRNGASHTINHTIVRTGTETIHFNVAPLTETHTVSETTHYVSSYSVSGSALTTAQGTTANFSGNSLTIGGATLTITPGAQPWCNLTYTSATLTSNGFVVSFTYNGGSGTVTIPVTWQTPSEEWEDVVYMVVTDGYEQQIFSAQSQRHQFLEIITYNSATGYKKFYKDVTNMPTVMPSRSSCDDSTSLTSAQYNFYVSSASNGFYATQVIPHNSLTILPDGVVKSEELTNWWQLTFRLANNTQAYVMGGSSWTMAGDSGRNALRGQADLANHTITVDYGGGTTRTWYFN